MRSEAEIETAIGFLERANTVLEAQMANEGNDMDFDELAGQFNSNSLMLCGLKYAMGESTMEFRP